MNLYHVMIDLKESGDELRAVIMSCHAKLSAFAARFAKRDDGAATVEAVIWLPFFFILFGLLADVSMVFHGQSKLLRIVQDANRNMSIGRLTTNKAVQDFVIARAGSMSKDPKATTVTSAGLILTTASVPMTDLDLFGVASVFKNVRMTVQAEHLMEN